MSIVTMFPGQGSQSVGMLAEAAEHSPIVQQRFAEASEVLSFDLWQLVQEGPADVLGQTENTQPALLTASVALWEALQALRAQPLEVQAMAGHSLGEYSALVCAGAISFADGVHLVRKRGELMQQAVPSGQGGMAAILGLDDAQVQECCAAVAGVVTAANYNAPGQIVIAGEKAAVADAIQACKDAGAKRALALDVSGPFHSPLMEPAAEEFSAVLSAIPVRMPTTPVVQNVHARVAVDEQEIRANLVAQLSAPVRWTESIEQLLSDGAEQFIESGPGNVLCGLVKRIARGTPAVSLSSQDGMQSAVEI
ncbi:MAG TPA: [acyl-carrier-protein] S-malonyltransferase [Gammaproteobacteria bacterium]|nr:[acyl-carrier-protein] S-malonyltransferase [Gammaproteobacteria bacterium]